jgi:alkylhydroperoxidase family enzyme
MPWIHVPEGIAPLAQVDALAPRLRAAVRRLRQSTLDETSLRIEEIEAVRVLSARLNGCRACSAFRLARDDPNRAGDAAARLDEGFYAAVLGDSPRTRLTERERLACELTERFVADHQALAADAPFWAHAQRLFGDVALVELVLSVSSFCMSARFNRVLDVDAICELDWPNRIAASS